MKLKSLSFLITWGLVAVGYFLLIPGAVDTIEAEKPAIVKKSPSTDPAPSPPSANLADLGSTKVELGKKQDSTGTAFSVGDNGTWITARHVIDGCSKVGIGVGSDGPDGPKQYIKAREYISHPNADIGILTAKWNGPSMVFRKTSPEPGQEGYHFGYPQGKPAAVRSRLLGQGRMRSVGRYQTRERVLVWADIERSPDFRGTLGGISGGPVTDADGHMIGVTVAGSVARGRIISTTRQTIYDILQKTNHTSSPPQGKEIATAAINRVNFAEIGHEFRTNRSITKVICIVD